MTVNVWKDKLDIEDAGRSMYRLIESLYPLCRSITGNGVRETLRMIRAEIPLDIHEVPTGTPVFDWHVPREWNIRGATLRDPHGRTVVDFADHNLHVVGYSVPVRRAMPLEELRPHLHTLPEHPDWIPYRTSYYHETWGFCLPHRICESLEDGEYQVHIDSVLENGSLTYGECVVPGEIEDEILVSAHVCHPSLCNDNLSGIAVAVALAGLLGRGRPRYTCRFLFIPGTIGSITWLARNRDALPRVRHGLVISCVGDPGRPTYKRSRRGTAAIDRAVETLLASRDGPGAVEDFSPYGYDERQFCSPGINLPVGLLTRTPWGRFPQYHTSADDLSFVTPGALADSLALLVDLVDLLERDRIYLNLNPYCEPQLGRRGLYDSLGGTGDVKEVRMAMLWVLNLSDGEHSLRDIAGQSGLRLGAVEGARDALVGAGLLREVGVRDG